jgi:hypothetical protein
MVYFSFVITRMESYKLACLHNAGVLELSLLYWQDSLVHVLNYRATTLTHAWHSERCQKLLEGDSHNELISDNERRSSVRSNMGTIYTCSVKQSDRRNRVRSAGRHFFMFHSYISAIHTVYKQKLQANSGLFKQNTTEEPSAHAHRDNHNPTNARSWARFVM